MKRTLTVAALATLFTLGVRAADSTAMVTNTGPARAGSSVAGHFAAGVILGEPTGASVKYWFNDTLAIDGAIGASFHDDANDDSSFYLHSDVLWHNFDLIRVSKGRMPVYLGAGALLRFRDDEDNQFGIRVPVGVSYLFEDVPLDIFVEIGPALDLAPGVRGEITGGIGIRFRF